MKILIVDDEIDICESLSTTLSLRGHSTLSCHNGLEALEILAQESVNLVISDINMPKLNGIDLLKKIKVDFPAVPLILMTGYVEYKIPELLAMGAHGVVSKPFSAADVLKLIDQLK